MKQLRRVIFWCHLAAGVCAGVVILVMSVTGVLLTYERQLIRWADTRGYDASPPSEGAARLPVEALLASVRESQSAAPTAVTVYSDANAPAVVSWTRNSVRAVTLFRRELGGKARDFNWHNVIGFWSALPLFVVVLSGVIISYTWASNLVYRVAGEQPPAQQQRGGPPGGQQGGTAPAPLDGLGALLSRAERQAEGWRSITFQLPPKPSTLGGAGAQGSPLRRTARKPTPRATNDG